MGFKRRPTLQRRAKYVIGSYLLNKLNILFLRSILYVDPEDLRCHALSGLQSVTRKLCGRSLFNSTEASTIFLQFTHDQDHFLLS